MSSSGTSAAMRPAAMKRASSQGQVPKSMLKSPGSELDLQPLRHQVRPKGHARIVLPRNHSSGRNLAKLARQAAAAGDNGSGKAHARQRSHEGDTEIRLPGSLDESDVRPPPIRRNYTSSNLPRNSSHTKLKKNFSHGQLQRLGTARDLVPLTSTARSKTPLSPGLRGKSKRPRSMDWSLDKDLHTREVELGMQLKEKNNEPKKVGFAVGSVGDDDDADEVPNMEGSGLDEGEWTEESASVSPFSTRQNTANNSRRESVQQERRPTPPPPPSNDSSSETDTETDDTANTIPQARDKKMGAELEAVHAGSYTSATSPKSSLAAADTRLPHAARSQVHAGQHHVNPTEELMRRRSGQFTAPALISNVTVMDDSRSSRTSPSASLRSSRSTTVVSGQDADELVSRFIPTSTSNGSGTTTNMQNTPKSGSFNAPDDNAFGRGRNAFSLGPVSPGSTVSGSSGTTTPALGRSRIELKMLQEKAIADMEFAAERGPLVPAHVYDRRNESLKSYLQLASLANNGGIAASSIPLSLGPEIFQGRFKAVNTELKVVQMFRNPVAESLNRLRARQGAKSTARPSSQKREASTLRMSKSAVALPVRSAQSQEPTPLSTSTSTSTSPSKTNVVPIANGKSALPSSKSSLAIRPARRAPSRGVSFAGADEHREFERDSNEASVDEIAKEMWDNVMT